jgi:ferritin-like metal-binding protein YciE
MSTSCASVYPAALIAAKKNTKAPPALDAGLLAAAQAVEHYEISRYGTLRAWAEELGLNEAVEGGHAQLCIGARGLWMPA